MSDIGNRRRRVVDSTSRLVVGDRVEIGEGDEHDTGTVVGFTFNGVRVHWDLADETYTEDYKDLRRML